MSNIATDPPAAATAPAPHPFRASRFEPSLGQAYSWRAFDAAGNAVAVAMTLVELKRHRSSPRWEQYSMLFTGPRETPLEQGSFEATNDVIGTETLFATALGPDEAGVPHYGVAVTRPLDDAEREALAHAPA